VRLGREYEAIAAFQRAGGGRGTGLRT